MSAETTESKVLKDCVEGLLFYLEATLRLLLTSDFTRQIYKSCFISSTAVAVGLCPTPQFLFGVQKGTEKDGARLRRFFLYKEIIRNSQEKTKTLPPKILYNIINEIKSEEKQKCQEKD